MRITEKFTMYVGDNIVQIVNDATKSFKPNDKGVEVQSNGLKWLRHYLDERIVCHEETNGFVPYNNFESSVDWKIINNTTEEKVKNMKKETIYIVTDAADQSMEYTGLQANTAQEAVDNAVRFCHESQTTAYPKRIDELMVHKKVIHCSEIEMSAYTDTARDNVFNDDYTKDEQKADYLEAGASGDWS